MLTVLECMESSPIGRQRESQGSMYSRDVFDGFSGRCGHSGLNLNRIQQGL